MFVTAIPNFYEFCNSTQYDNVMEFRYHRQYLYRDIKLRSIRAWCGVVAKKIIHGKTLVRLVINNNKDTQGIKSNFVL